MSHRFEIVPCADEELPHLFGFAKGTFAGVTGWNDRRVLETLMNDLLFVAHEEGLAAGYVAMRQEQDGTFLVEQLFVVPGHEHRHICDLLLDYVEGYAIAERAPALRIVVERANEPARSFIRRWGFVPVEAELFELMLPAAG